MQLNSSRKVIEKPCKITNLNDLLLNQRFQRSLIAKGCVLKLLLNNNKAYSDMEMSIILDISVWLIRAELKSLLNNEPIGFKQNPLKLVTEYIDGKLQRSYELATIIYWHLSHKELTISLTKESLSKGGKNA